jgi:ankyrin repeat protein
MKLFQMFLYIAFFAIPVISEEDIEKKDAPPQKKETIPAKKGDYNFKKKQNQLIKELISAAEYGNFVDVRKAVETQLVNLNSVDRRGLTAIHAAAQNGQMEIVRYLIQFKVDINTTAKSKETPLISTLSRGHLKVATLLIENGADINVTNHLGQTPLMLAAGNGSIDIVKTLIESGANPNYRDNEGNTALMLALLSGNVDVVIYLIENKADINLKNKEGKTAVQWATENGLTDIVELLSKNKTQLIAKNEVVIGTAGVLKDGVIQIKPKEKLPLKAGQVVYFLDETGEEVAIGKITILNPKFIRVKLQSGEVQNGQKAIFYK